jgi:hypothetical protein
MLDALSNEGTWRTGSKVRRTIYCGPGPEELIGVMDLGMDAAFVAAAPSIVRQLLDELEAKP